MATISQQSADQRFLLHNVSWGVFEELASGDGIGARLTYDRGELELMSPSSEHEWFKTLFGRMIEALTVELNVPIRSAGSTTFKKELLQRGLEPDECYYIRREAAVRGRDEIDLNTDPPPDLVVEIEVSRSLLDRLGIYAALGVPEIWSYDGEKLRVRQLAKDGSYSDVSQSLNLPMVPVVDLERFLKDRTSYDETTLMRSFRDWVRATLIRE